MIKNLNDDTIVAISTPIGEGGIGIVRISGRNAVKIADKIFVSRDKNKPSKFKSHTIHYGYVVDSSDGRWTIDDRRRSVKKAIDEVLLTVMRAPKTYTKEDVVEINCHGGIVAIRKTLELVVRSGARLAEPGEFTKRAFLNGRLDLAQAEAVLDIIRSKTEAGLRASLNQLEGELSKEIRIIRNNIIEACADIEAAIDFPDEYIDTGASKSRLKILKICRGKLEKLLETYHDGAILREGVVVVICGRPNVGKSSLLNLLLRKNRAIVTHIPGTTRDPIEETASIKGIPMRLVDTAGIRKEKNIVEKEGIKRSHLYLSRADLIICLLDGSEKLKKEDMEILSKIRQKPAIIVINKCDLRPKVKIDEIKRVSINKDVLKISCVNKIGIDKLEGRIYNKVWSGGVSASNEVMVNNIRHKDAMESAVKALYKAEEGICKNLSFEFIASDLRMGVDLLGKIIGETYTDDILTLIFSKFCIGK